MYFTGWGGSWLGLAKLLLESVSALGLWGLRDSRNAGPRAWKRANAISRISDLLAQIWKFEEAQPALPDCKET